MTATDTTPPTPMTIAQYESLVELKGGLEKLNKGEAVAYLQARIDADPGEAGIPPEVLGLLENLVGKLGTTTNVSFLAGMSEEEIKVMAHAFAQGWKGTQEEFMTELKLSTAMLETRTSTELWTFAVDVRKAAVAKMGWGEYVKYLTLTYGPAVAAGVAAVVVAQYGAAWWNANQDTVVDDNIIDMDAAAAAM